MDEISLSCRKCRMIFKDKAQLSNHLTHFCSGSRFANPKELLTEIQKGNRLDFEDVADGISGKGQANGMTLEQVRTLFNSNATESEMKELRNKIDEQRAMEHRGKLEELRRQKQTLSTANLSSQNTLIELLKEAERDKDIEQQAKLERERLKREVGQVSETYLRQMTEEKRKEVAELQRLRQRWKAKEEEILGEISQLEKDLNQERQVFQHEQDALEQAVTKGVLSAGNTNAEQKKTLETTRDRIYQATKHYAKQSAQLEAEKEGLLQRRAQLIKELKNSDVSAAKQTEMFQDLDQSCEEQFQRVQKLRDAFRRDKAAMKTDLGMMDAIWEDIEQQNKDGSDVPLNLDLYFNETELKSDDFQIESEIAKSVKLKRQASVKQALQRVPKPKEKPAKTLISPVRRRKRRVSARKRVSDTRPRSSKKDVPVKPNADDSNLTEPIKKDTNPAPKQPEQVPKAPELKKEEVKQTAQPTVNNGGPSMKPIEHWGGMMAPPMQMYHPMMTGQMGMPAVLQATLKLVEAAKEETERLQQQIREMEERKEVRQLSKERREFMRTMQMIQQSGKQPGILAESTEIMDEDVPQLARDKGLGLGALSKEARRIVTLMERFPKGSDEHKMYAKQLTELSEQEFRMSKLENEKKVLKMRNETIAYKKELELETGHKLFVEERRRMIERARLEREMKAKGVGNPIIDLKRKKSAVQFLFPKACLIPLGNKESGELHNIHLNFDFVIFPSNLNHGSGEIESLRLTSQLKRAGELDERSLKFGEWYELFQSNNGERVCVIDEKMQIAVQPGRPLIDCLVSVEVRHREDKSSHRESDALAWTVFPLVSLMGFANMICVGSGGFRVACLLPPIDPTSSSASLTGQIAEQQKQVSSVMLYFRIVPDGRTDSLQPCNTALLDEYRTHNISELSLEKTPAVTKKPLPKQINHRTPVVMAAKQTARDTTAGSNRRPSSQIGRVPEKPPTAKIAQIGADMQATLQSASMSEQSEHIPNTIVEVSSATVSIGLLIKICENYETDFSYAKVRVRLVNLSSLEPIVDPETGLDLVWDTPVTETGLSGIPHTFEWECRMFFDQISLTSDSGCIFELFFGDTSDLDDLARNEHGQLVPVANQATHDMLFADAECRLEPEHLRPVVWSFCSLMADVRADPNSGLLINVGIQSVPLYLYPINLHSAELVDGFEDSPSQLVCFVYTAETEPILADSRLVTVDGQIVNGNGLVEWDTTNGLGFQSNAQWSSLGSDAIFIPYERPEMPSQLYTQGEGVDIYIDGARCLPDNVTVTKVYMQIMWQSSSNQIIKKGVEEAHCGFTDSCFTPHFYHRCEIRDDNLDPMTMLIFRVDTLERYSRKVECVGYAGLNLFNQPGDINMPLESHTRNFCLNVGAFQIPIHLAPPPFEDLKVETFHTLPSLPCASLLVRIREPPRSVDGTTILSISDVPESQWEELGLIEPAPLYSQGVYENLEPTPEENVLFKIRAERAEQSIKDTLTHMFPDIDESVFHTEEEWSEWIAEHLKAPPKDELVFVDLKYFARYNEKYGLTVAIDGLFNMDSLIKPTEHTFSSGTASKEHHCLFVVIYSISPPASFYQPFKLTDEVEITWTWDMNSYVKHPTFDTQKNLHTFVDIAHSKNAILVCDIRKIVFDVNEEQMDQVEFVDDTVDLIPYGWAVFPLFEMQQKESCYVKGGCFQGPIFKGALTEQLLMLIDQQPNITEMLHTYGPKTEAEEKSARKKKKKEKSDNDEILKQLLVPTDSSILVRIFDQQRSSLPEEAFTEIDQQYLPKNVRRQMVYQPTPAVKKGWFFQSTAKMDRLEHLLPHQASSTAEFSRMLAQKIVAKLDINHYHF